MSTINRYDATGEKPLYMKNISIIHILRLLPRKAFMNFTYLYFLKLILEEVNFKILKFNETFLQKLLFQPLVSPIFDAVNRKLCRTVGSEASRTYNLYLITGPRSQ